MVNLLAFILKRFYLCDKILYMVNDGFNRDRKTDSRKA